MKDSKDIFDLFKNNEDKLNQPPSNRAWDRLEGRLDNHQMNKSKHRLEARRAPKLIRKWLSMTGVVLMLILAISTLTIVFQSKPNSTAMNMKSSPNSHFVVEEIGLYSDQDKIRKDIDLYRAKLDRLNTNPILEGDPAKELRVKQSVFVDLKLENEQKSLATKTNKKPRQIAEVRKTEKDSPAAKADLRKKAEKRKATASKVEGGTSVTFSAQADAVEMPPEDAAFHGTAPEVATSSSYSLESYQGSMSNSTSSISISSLAWLLGEWEAGSNNKSTEGNISAASADLTENSNSRSIEEWTQINSTTINGNGFIINVGVRTKTESVRITERNSSLYYILKIENQAPLQYKLKSYTPAKIIFENQELPFPNQVILEKAGNRFITTFQNDSPVELQEDLKKYFEQRSEISAGQIKRVMVKQK